MPTIYTRTTKDGKASYYANLTNNNNRVRKALGNDKKLALKRLKKLEYDLFLNSTKKVRQKCLHEAVQSFEQYLSTTGITTKQISVVSGKIRNFAKFLSTKNIININNVKREHSSQFINNRSRQTVNSNYTLISPTTLNREIGFLKRFFTFCIENDWTDKNPFLGIKIAKTKRTSQRYSFKDCEIDIILDAADEFQDFLSFLLHTGLRCTDAFKLKPKHLVDGYLKLQMNKTGDFLNVPLPDAIKKLLTLRMADEYIFAEVRTDWQRRQCLKSVQKHFTRDFVRSNNINLHTFRHTYAHTMLNKGVLQTLLGHRSIKTTEIYANWIKKKELERWV